MKFKVVKTSWQTGQKSDPLIEGVTQDEEGKWWVDLKTLEDLLKFIDKCGEDIIINDAMTIEIYDDWRE